MDTCARVRSKKEEEETEEEEEDECVGARKTIYASNHIVNELCNVFERLAWCHVHEWFERGFQCYLATRMIMMNIERDAVEAQHPCSTHTLSLTYSAKRANFTFSLSMSFNLILRSKIQIYFC